jgi:hypothetical protein
MSDLTRLALITIFSVLAIVIWLWDLANIIGAVQ